MRAVTNGHSQIVKALLAAGDPKKLCVSTHNGGKTIMGAAALQGNVEIVQMLLAAGADINKRDKVSWRCLFRMICFMWFLLRKNAHR